MCVNNHSPGTDREQQIGVEGSAGEAFSRRDFLAGCAALSVGGSLQPARFPGDQDDGVVWALISDTHIDSSPDKSVRGSNMTEHLKQVVQEVLACSPDRVLFNGDIANKNGLAGDYESFLRIVKPLSDRNLPLHFTIGNHDRRQAFVDAVTSDFISPVEGRCVSTRLEGGIHWIFLDSRDSSKRLAGVLGAGQLEWLRKELDSRKELPAIVCLHHHPQVIVHRLERRRRFARHPAAAKAGQSGSVRTYA